MILKMRQIFDLYISVYLLIIYGKEIITIVIILIILFRISLITRVYDIVWPWNTFLWCRYDRKVESIARLIPQGIPELDEWEMPRDQVVLNRQLGQGEFGTVYGGEAKIENVWVAVAVKTLKVGSSTDDKASWKSDQSVTSKQICYELNRWIKHAN